MSDVYKTHGYVKEIIEVIANNNVDFGLTWYNTVLELYTLIDLMSFSGTILQ